MIFFCATNLYVLYISPLVHFYFSFVHLLRLVDGCLRAHRPNASFSFVYCVWPMGACAPIDQTLRFRQGSVNCVRTFSWGAAAPQPPRDDGLNLARPSAKISPKTKRLVDGRTGAHQPNAIDERTSKKVATVTSLPFCATYTK